MRSYLLGSVTAALNDIVSGSPTGSVANTSQLRSVPAHLRVTLLPTNTATFSGLFVNCPHTTETKHNVYTIPCHDLNIRCVTLSVATHKLHRAGSGLNYEDNF